MKVLHMIAFILLVIGGLNWGLVGIGYFANANWNVVTWICGYIGGTPVESVVYILVGLSALWLVIGHKKDCKTCSA